MTRLLVVGDALLDRDLEGEVERLCPEAPVPVVEDLVGSTRPGGAGLAATLAARDGYAVSLVTALARDAAGRELRRLLGDAGVDVLDLGLEGATPEKVRVRTRGRLMIRLDHGGRRPGLVAGCGRLPDADAVLVSDYGRGVAEAVRRELSRDGGGPPLVWDPHPEGRTPVPGATLATPNRSEAFRLAAKKQEASAAVALCRRWRVSAVAVTLGERGAVLAEAGAEPVLVPCEPVVGGDPCGAGDRFASAVAIGLAEGAGVAEAVVDAVARASAFVAAGGAGALAAALEHDAPYRGRLIATGGCFDLLHAGHVHTLQAARALGDRLVVLLNSDASVRRLKGPGRPLQPQEDRAAVLRALGCVDEVVVFDEDTPAEALERLRPDVWVKGGDYATDELPESRVVGRYGGRVEIVPYVAGRSTTRLIAEAALRDA